MRNTKWSAVTLLWFAAACDPSTRGQGVDGDPGLGPSDASPDATEPTGAHHRGTIVVSEHRRRDERVSQTLVSVPVDQLFGGSVATAGGCDYFPNAPHDQSVGTVTFVGLRLPVREVPASPTPPVTYSHSGAGYPDLFAEGDAITFIASGETGGVPSFSGIASAPSTITNAVLPLALSRSTVPTVTWDADVTGSEMWLWIVASRAYPERDTLLWCRLPDTGTYTLPAEAHALLPAGAPMATITLWRTNAVTVATDALPIDLTVADAVVEDLIPFVP